MRGPILASPPASDSGAGEAEGVARPSAPASRGRAAEAWGLVLGNPLSALGVALMAGLLVLAVAGPALTPYDPVATDPGARLMRPGARHLMGTDNFGRDVLSRVLVATRLDLFIAVTAVGTSLAVGVVLGAASGYYRGVLDQLVMRGMDIMQAFPPFILAIGLAAAFGAGVANIIYVVAIIQVPIYTRLVRGDFLSARERPWVEAARCAGCRGPEIIAVHMLPNTLPPVLVQAAVNMSWAILNAAGLSFIGLGVKPPTPEWGVMIREGAEFVVSGEWWLALFPGLAIFLAVLAFNLIADGLRDLLDPHLRR